MRLLIIATCTVILLLGCGQSDNPAEMSGGSNLPSGIYAVDRSHTYLSFSYLHQGLSYPLLRVTDIMGELEYDASNLSASDINIAVGADSIRTNVANFDKELASRKFFNAQNFPHITFSSDRFEATNEAEGILYGNVTIKGIMRPMELAVTFNNGIIHPVLDVPVLGFSATGSLSRSDFGLDRFVPVVSDTVVLNIEIEFLHGSTEESAVAAALASDDV